MTRPHLDRSERRTSHGLVLMLHGGMETNHAPVGRTSLPWWRMRLMMLQLQGPFHRAGLDTWLLRYGSRGWNSAAGREAGPVGDARWALDRVRAQHGDRPVLLLGHSMGARTAAVVSDDPNVRGVVALAPWFPPGQPVAPLTGKGLVAAHGRADRMTSFQATEAYVARARQVAASAELVDMGDLDHAMVRGLGRWNEVARRGTLDLARARVPRS